MAKWYGVIGYAETVEIRPGVWKDQITERTYSGDLIRNTSRFQNAEKLNEIGTRIAEELGVTYLQSDFKKKNGYKRSTELSKEYGMYRQDYCGCVYSYRERHS